MQLLPAHHCFRPVKIGFIVRLVKSSMEIDFFFVFHHGDSIACAYVLSRCHSYAFCNVVCLVEMQLKKKTHSILGGRAGPRL